MFFNYLYNLAIKLKCVSIYWRLSEIFFIFNLSLSFIFLPLIIIRKFLRKKLEEIYISRFSTKINWSLFFKNLIELLSIKFLLLITGLVIILSLFIIYIFLIFNDISFSESNLFFSTYHQKFFSQIRFFFEHNFMVISVFKKFINYLLIIINFLFIIHIFLGFLGLIYDYIIKKFEIFKSRRRFKFLFNINNYFIFIFLMVLLLINFKYIIMVFFF